MQPLQGLALLLLLQSVGETLSHFLELPVPGPVVGMVLLVPVLRWVRVQQAVAPAAGFLLGHLSLLFIPVGVGVMTHLALLSTHGLRLIGVIVVSTWISMAVTALVLQLWRRADSAKLR